MSSAPLKKGRDSQKTSSIVVVAEGGDQGNANEVADKVMKELPELDIRVTNLGHIQRGGSPTSFDRILASRLGMASCRIPGQRQVWNGGCY